MAPVSLNPELVAKLTSNGGEVPLTDNAGKPVGYFVSSAIYTAMQNARYDQAFADISDDEVQRALADPRRHTMEEVLQLLEGN